MSWAFSTAAGFFAAASVEAVVVVAVTPAVVSGAGRGV